MSAQRLIPRLVLLALLVALTAPLSGPAAAHGGHQPPPATVRIGVFARSLPMLAADAKGFNAKYNLTVQYLQVTSSTQQFQALRDGEYDMVQTSPDNVANYRLNASNPLGATIDQQMFVGFDSGQKLILVAKPGITSPADLRGKTLAVDALNSGFAYVLYKIMQNYGLQRGTDYNVVSVGGVFQRYNGLLANQFDATLLSSGFETRAANAGYVLLDSVSSIANPYLGSVGAGKTAWLRQNRDAVERFTKAYIEASRWSFDPANREEAIGLLMTLPNTPRALAEQLYAIQVTVGVGNIPDASIDREALYNVLALRAEFNGFDQRQNLRFLASPASRLYDLSYYRRARAELRHDR